MAKSSVLPPAAARTVPFGVNARPRTISFSSKFSKIFSMEVVSARIDIRVGVASGSASVGEGGGKVGRLDGSVALGAGDVEVDKISEEEGVGKVWTEKLQASRPSELNTRITINTNHFGCCMAFSLSAVTNKMESPFRLRVGNDYKTFAPDFLFPVRKTKQGTTATRNFQEAGVP